MNKLLFSSRDLQRFRNKTITQVMTVWAGLINTLEKERKYFEKFRGQR
jgi:hypothetical protein